MNNIFIWIDINQTQNWVGNVPYSRYKKRKTDDKQIYKLESDTLDGNVVEKNPKISENDIIKCDVKIQTLEMAEFLG